MQAQTAEKSSTLAPAGPGKARTRRRVLHGAVVVAATAALSALPGGAAPPHADGLAAECARLLELRRAFNAAVAADTDNTMSEEAYDAFNAAIDAAHRRVKRQSGRTLAEIQARARVALADLKENEEDSAFARTVLRELLRLPV